MILLNCALLICCRVQNVLIMHSLYIEMFVNCNGYFNFFNFLQEIIPIINWETETFSTPVLTVLVFTSVAVFPTLLLPSTPSMWVAGMTFGYGFGFLLIISAAAIGVSLPFVIGKLFHHKIEVHALS